MVLSAKEIYGMENAICITAMHLVGKMRAVLSFESKYIHCCLLAEVKFPQPRALEETSVISF